ncbi:Zinc finger BED domain-containing protein RICESLEEPER 1 [Euphorbia peplus]|nr:Zinc finger BED domain-containing protein RICESLEEPER 1 [Euphorbia peplus]
MIKNVDTLLSGITTQMKKKLDKNWENETNLNFILFVAVVLDPPFKLGYVGLCFDEVYDEIRGKIMKDKVEETLNRLYSHYLMFESNDTRVYSSSQASDEMQYIEDLVVSFQQKFSRHRKGIQRLEKKSEVAKYLSESYEDVEDSFDILAWWKNNVSKYPTLSRVAKDVLAILVSTVASKSNFRSCVKPELQHV